MSIKKSYQQLKEKFVQLFGRMFFHDVPSITLIAVSLILLLSLFLMIIFRVNSGDSMVPITYNSIYGVTSSVVWYKLYFLPVSYLVILSMNILISWAFFEKERLITYMVLFVSIILGIIMTIVEYNLTTLIRG
jgi:hypothetical protein